MHGIDDLLVRNDIKRAEVAIARYLRTELTDQERAKALMYRAKTRLRSQRPDDALSDLRIACDLNTEYRTRPDVIELLGDAHLARFEIATVGFADRSDTSQAQAYFQQILETFPDYRNRGWIYYQLGRIALTNNAVESAEQYFQRALLTPSSVRALTAYCYERLGFTAFYETRDLDLAVGFLDKAIDTYPASENQAWLVQVHILRSRVLRERQEYRSALAAADSAVRIATGTGSENRTSLAEALLTFGEMLSGFDGRERDTVTCLQQFLATSKKPLGVDVTWSRVHEMLGDAHFKLMQYDLASEAYEAVLQYNPYHPWEISLHYRIAQSYYQQNDYLSTIAAIERLINAAQSEEEQITDYRVYDVLGNAHFALGHYIEAEESYRRALEAAPPNAEGLEKIKKYYHFAQELS
ncbi:MAG: tetratricopeptide repeat protein [Anaerolineae bacterium]|nr:tetratricopeptide repeat protein [Anaerolineae bacterium]